MRLFSNFQIFLSDPVQGVTGSNLVLMARWPNQPARTIAIKLEPPLGLNLANVRQADTQFARQLIDLFSALRRRGKQEFVLLSAVKREFERIAIRFVG